ncbi:MAG: 4Fe-4S dicluster domain-containing protein [Pirellulales bacterium]
MLQWSADDVVEEAGSCNGCGICRTQLPDQRMCPIFRIGPGEEASPRAKANLFRGVVTGELDPASIATPRFKEVADLCVHCHQCRVECPAEVDIPSLMFEAKAAHVAVNGLKIKQWFLADIDRVSRWGSRFPGIANWMLGNRQARWVFERFLGLAHNRKLPRLGKQTFQRWAAKRNLIRPRRRNEVDPRKVLVFADTAINYYDAQLGRALVLVLEHNGASVYVPPEPLHAGMPFVQAGALDKVRAAAATNVPLLAEAVRQGYTIVAAEPSTVMCLTREYPQLLDDEDVRMVATNTYEATDYLWRLHQHGELQLDLSPVHANVGYHQPCHSRVLQNGAPAENLLRLIAGLQVVKLDRGCSGMAGTYGLSKDNFRNSLRAGRAAIDALRDAPLQAAATECTACKMQLEQGSSKPTLHPLKWLALSYGLMPELAESWQARSSDAVTPFLLTN